MAFWSSFFLLFIAIKNAQAQKVYPFRVKFRYMTTKGLITKMTHKGSYYIAYCRLFQDHSKYIVVEPFLPFFYLIYVAKNKFLDQFLLHKPTGFNANSHLRIFHSLNSCHPGNPNLNFIDSSSRLS
jgi:hypothetical protein